MRVTLNPIKDATEKWVASFSSIPREMIRRLMKYEPDEWNEVTVSQKELYNADELPIWGTMWSMGNSLDESWLNSKTGLNAISKCGFRIFEHKDFGYFFGIDGAGYDFYEEHWIPVVQGSRVTLARDSIGA